MYTPGNLSSSCTPASLIVLLSGHNITFFCRVACWLNQSLYLLPILFPELNDWMYLFNVMTESDRGGQV